MDSYNILRNELVKLWDLERADRFMEETKKKIDEDQLEALSKMIGYVEEQYEDLTEEILSELMLGMDTFEGPLEFLEYFFKMSQEEEIAADVVARMKEDPEEIEAMLESMEDSGILEYIVSMDAFYVWYKG